MSANIVKVLLLLLPLFSVVDSFCQVDKNVFSKSVLFVNTFSNYTIQSTGRVNAISVKIWEGDFTRSYIRSGKDTFFLAVNHESRESDFNLSQLIFLKNTTDSILFYSGKVEGNVEIHTYATTSSISYNSLRVTAGACEAPESISPKIWRVGLPPPKKSPDSTKVEHVIVHHSATSLVNTDPVSAVRSIYLYHTATQGWDDIAYNFLIAPDGTIFQGRDDMGLYNKDNVLGAHYCGKNSNTMGICLLGDFTKAPPQVQAMEALYKLTGWKITKENIDPFGSTQHPHGSSTLLPNIAGHRDNCSTGTECPGDFLYAKLQQVRIDASEQKLSCSHTSVIALYPNPVVSYINFKNLEGEATVSITDVNGKVVLSEKKIMEEINVNFLSSGLYLLKISTPSGISRFKFVKE